MTLSVKERVELRQLAAGGRTGQYARRRAHSLLTSMGRRLWWLLVVVALCPVTAVMPVLLMSPTPMFLGFLLGAAVTGGIAAAAVVLLVGSGATPLIAGAWAEYHVAAAFRAHRRHGWRLVNRVRLYGDADIDHVVVGPPGIWLVETKWTTWPDKDVDLSSLRRNMWRLKTALPFKAAIAGAPVRGLLVRLHPPDQDVAPARHYSDVTVIDGDHLHGWIASMDDVRMSAEQVREVWSAIAGHVGRRDPSDHQRGLDSTPTLIYLLFRWLLLPVAAAFLAIGMVAGIGRIGEGAATQAATFPVAAGVGLLVGRMRLLKPASRVWVVLFLLVSLIVVIWGAVG